MEVCEMFLFFKECLYYQFTASDEMEPVIAISTDIYIENFECLLKIDKNFKTVIGCKTAYLIFKE